MSAFINIKGKRYGKLVALEYQGSNKWLCRCDCGNKKSIYGSGLRFGYNRSCGCLRDGRSKTVEHTCWVRMRQRCSNPNNKDYHNYGARGIKVCRRWLGKSGFDNFLKDIGPRPPGSFSIDRIRSDGHYAPSNCRWANPLQQGENTRRVRLLEHNGRKMSMNGWAKEIGISDDTIAYRIKLGQTIGDIIRLKEDGLMKDGKQKMITLKGKTMNQLAWARELKIPQPTLSWQLNHGRTIEEIAAKAGY